MPHISIILPFFNAQAFLAEAVDSVIAQTFGDWELLLIDDGSADGSGAIAQRYADADPHRISLLHHEGGRNRGLPASRNLGLDRARAEWVALLDADDVWRPTKLARQAEIVVHHPQAAMIFGKSEYWHDWAPGNGLSNVVPPLAPTGLHFPPALLCMTYPLGPGGSPCPSNLVFRREAARQLGGFVEEFAGPWEDIAFISKMLLHWPAYVSDECWDRYRVHASSMSARARETGAEAQGRRFYFSWLETYLRASAVDDARVWKRYRAKTWEFRHPRAASAYRALRATARRFIRR